MEQTGIEGKMNSLEYISKLEEMLKVMIVKIRAATTEASIASVVETELFYFIKTYLNKNIIIDKELGNKDLKLKGHKGSIFTGRVDAISNDLLIEYKRASKLITEKDQEKATSQVKGYLLQLNDETKIEYNAVLTDGQKIRYFYYSEKKLHYTPFKNIEVEDLNKLVRSLVIVGNKKFVPRNIVQDFKLNSTNLCTLKLAKCLFHIINRNITEKTDMLFQEWQELFHLSENDRGQNLDIEKRKNALGKIFDIKIEDAETDYKALFVLQTTYAIIVKLLACKVITKLSSDSEEENIKYFSDLSNVDSNKLRCFMENLEDGYTFAIGGIRNLLEGDFFSWYAAENQWNSDEAVCIMNIITILEGYSVSSFAYGYTAIDIFKDLYMEIMPNEVRHSLGEYFTPSWLADCVIENSKGLITNSKWKAIDPCCGSGIFIVSLIRHVIGNREILNLSCLEKEQLLKEILERVQGVDINPLSVLTARVSYLLAIMPLMGNSKIEIPVYLGDSANIPYVSFLDGVKCYQYTVQTKQGSIEIILPCKFVESSNFLEKMSLLQTTIKAKNISLVYEKLVSCIDKEDQNEKVLECINRLSNRLVELQCKHWDGIWLRIITNYMLVARIKNKDIIVGNPPWVKWEFLPQLYAEKIKALCLNRHLFSGQTYMGAISLNICALIANVTAASWLNEDGVLAFLMPKTLMTQDSYAGFRNFYINAEENKRLYLQKVDDWTKSGNPFIYTTEKFLTYYFQQKSIDYSQGIPMKYIAKRKGIDVKEINSHSTYAEVEEFFDYKNGKALQLDEKRTGFTMIESGHSTRTQLYSHIIGTSEYKARSGVEFTPAEIYFIEPLENSYDDKRYKFQNSEFSNSVYKIEFNKEIELEKKFVRPVIKSPCIKEFGIIDSYNYCIFPYDEGSVECVAINDLNDKSEYLSNYFIGYKELIEKQSKRSRMISKGNEFYALSKVGKYTYGENIVTFRDNTKLVASVVKPIETVWGEEKMPICAKHSPYISMDKYNRFITEDEAYFLSGILNTNVVQEYFKFTFSGRSYSIDFNIKMPLYDYKNKYHNRIVQLSKEAHNSFMDIPQIIKIKIEMEKLYLKICDEEF